LDILINNAGGGVQIAPIEAQTPESIADCLNLNLASVINGCAVVAPVMQRQQSGLIINVTSACAQFAWPGWSVYSAAKAGVAMFSRCLYTELRPHGVAVTVLAPGGANTGFQSAAGIGAFDWDDSDSLRAEHIAHAALAVATMPHGAVVPHLVAYGMSQDIVPF
jgi:NAD(P)-dependent dehydrogenase (short-subunit alcohol dehydrogenase family)